MKKRGVRPIFLIAFLLAVSAWSLAHGSGFPQSTITTHDATDKREFDNVYNAITFPNISTGTAQNFTIVNATFTNVSVTKVLTAVTGSTTTLDTANISSGTIPSFAVTGTKTNDNAPVGRPGEYIESVVPVASRVLAVTTTHFQDLTSISLSAGDWDVTFFSCYNYNTGITGQFYGGISTTSGNSATGLISGSNLDVIAYIGGVLTSTTLADQPGDGDFCLKVPVYRMSLSATTPVYAKVAVVYASGSPAHYGRLSARRVR
jgi:hypothetical protein